MEEHEDRRQEGGTEGFEQRAGKHAPPAAEGIRTPAQQQIEQGEEFGQEEQPERAGEEQRGL